MEIERKYLIHKLPEDLETYPCRKIQQAYLCTNPVVRIRRQDQDYYLTYKGGGLMVREEYNLPLNKDAYQQTALSCPKPGISCPLQTPLLLNWTSLILLTRDSGWQKWNFLQKKRLTLLSLLHGLEKM